MPSVFLSYDRRDTARAKPIATALEKAGHSVWWDMHVRGGAQFAKAIEEALKQAEAVVVLWSFNSVDSAWVRDEAGAGRDSGRLIPLKIDGTETPLGFRQFQCLDFSRWKGRPRAKEFQQLLNSIDVLGGTPASTPPRLPDRGAPRIAAKRSLVSGIVIVAVLAIGAMVAVRMLTGQASIPTIAVAAADPSSQSQALARDLFVMLGRLQEAVPNALEIAADPATKGVDFTFQVSASTTREKAAANLALLAADRTLLWSKDFDRPGDQYGDLKQQLALMGARVLTCATEGVADKDAKLDQRTLKLYLNGCANLSDFAWQDFRGLVPVFREVTRRAPKFDGGWAKLVATEAFVIGWETVPSNSPEGRTLTNDIAAARRVNPHMPETYWAEYMLVGEYDLVRAAEVLDRAVRDNPDDPAVAGMQVPLLRRVGRLKEALDASKRAAGHDILDPGRAAEYIELLAYSGHFDTALQEINKAEKLWPGTRPLIESRFRYYLRYGDPKEALHILHSGIYPDPGAFESFLKARIDPSKENVDRAIADAQARIGQSPRAVGWLVQALAEFGCEDAIYPIIEGPGGKSALYLSDALFRPQFRRLRQNPRFMKSAKNIGLVDYWQKSGKWPDFCFEPGLSYDCKKEASRLAS